mmetsp:Transcript_5367/g.17637  ORF Transcript_5367/g.17637 Transcript_5367/m.17637 type:complete len:225 (-) Transcript_5367:1393-2067(-)
MWSLRRFWTTSSAGWARGKRRKKRTTAVASSAADAALGGGKGTTKSRVAGGRIPGGSRSFGARTSRAWASMRSRALAWVASRLLCRGGFVARSSRSRVDAARFSWFWVVFSKTTRSARRTSRARALTARPPKPRPRVTLAATRASRVASGSTKAKRAARRIVAATWSSRETSKSSVGRRSRAARHADEKSRTATKFSRQPPFASTRHCDINATRDAQAASRCRR